MNERKAEWASPSSSMQYCCCHVRLCPRCCTESCLSPAERQIRTTADMLFDIVNTEENCCGCKDERLSRTETMLLLRVLQDESRHSLRMHGGLIHAFIQQLRMRTSEDSQGGKDITRSELADALLVATGEYQAKAVSAIAAELKRDYAQLDAPAAAAMDRGLAPGHGQRPLLG